MNLLFKNIPLSFNAIDLAEIIENLFTAGHIDRDYFHISAAGIEIMETQDGFCHPIEKFAVLRISPPEVAQQVIKELDGCFVEKLKITVREFYKRSVSNDPRSDNDAPEVMMEQRKNDRRAHTLISSRHI